MAKTKTIADEEVCVMDKLSQNLAAAGSLSDIEFRAAKYALQVLIENAIGKAKNLLKHFGCPVVPSDGREAFRFMHETGMIDATQYSAFTKAVGFRNILIHDYMNLDPQILYRIVETREYLAIHAFLVEIPNYPKFVIERIRSYHPAS